MAVDVGYSFQVLSGSLYHRVKVIGNTTGICYASMQY
jgi:hypothetical protein